MLTKEQKAKEAQKKRIRDRTNAGDKGLCIVRCGRNTGRADGICKECKANGVTVYSLMQSRLKYVRDEWDDLA